MQIRLYRAVPVLHRMRASAGVGALLDTVLNMTLGGHEDLGELTLARCGVIASACEADMSS